MRYRSYRIYHFQVNIFLLMVLLPGILLFSFSCLKEASSQAIFLDFTRSQPEYISSSQAPDDFDETACQVLRCTSCEMTDTGMSISVTRSKSVEIKSLIFLNLEEAQDSGSSSVSIAYLELSGGESEYDLAQASYYQVNQKAAHTAVAEYGFKYEDWLTGTLSQDELFPCCK
jgi:hypothetical protein